LTREEKQLLTKKVEQSGFDNVSDFIRSVIKSENLNGDGAIFYGNSGNKEQQRKIKGTPRPWEMERVLVEEFVCWLNSRAGYVFRGASECVQ
jgi:hypothetical protein